MPTLISLALLFMVSLYLPSFANSDECNSAYLVSKKPKDSVISVDAINGILKSHNEARRKVSPYAKVMPMLQWSECIASHAQDYANKCLSEKGHSSEAERTDKCNFTYLGENLASGTNGKMANISIGGEHATNRWNSEEKDWNYPSCVSGKVCGHYTQNIWAATTHVGCGFKSCGKNKGAWVCQYGVGGNTGGKPYEVADTINEAAPCTFGKYTSGASAPSGLVTLTMGILIMALVF